MAKAQGWIPIHRQIQEHWVWDEKPFSKGQAWIDLLLLANHDDNKFLLGNELVKVKCGSFITSELKLMARWGWGKGKTRAFLELLQNDGMIIKLSDRKKTTITIVNYSDYAVLKTKDKPRTDRKRTTNGPQADTNNNDNNENNENKYDNKLSYSEDAELNKTIVSFIEFRKKIKKPLTDHAIELLINKLNKMTSSTSEQIEILNQSIVNGWQGIFPLKRNQKKPKLNYEKKANYDFEVINSWMNKDDPPTAADDENIKARAEALQKELTKNVKGEKLCQ